LFYQTQINHVHGLAPLCWRSSWYTRTKSTDMKSLRNLAGFQTQNQLNFWKGFLQMKHSNKLKLNQYPNKVWREKQEGKGLEAQIRLSFSDIKWNTAAIMAATMIRPWKNRGCLQHSHPVVSKTPQGHPAKNCMLLSILFFIFETSSSPRRQREREREEINCN